MKIGFDAKRYYHNQTGLGNYSRTIVGGIQKVFPESDCVLYDEKSLARTFTMAKKAKADGCQLFHGLSNEIPFCIPNGLPTVVTVHDVCWRTYPEMYHFFDRHIYDLKYGSSCKRADKVIAISESTKRDVMQIYGVPAERIEVIYQPVQEYYYTPLTDAEATQLVADHFGEGGLPPFILYVGSINSRKNLLGVLKALALIPKEQRPLLLVVGNGHEYRKECEYYIAANNLSQYVRIETGIHNNRLLQALYTQAIAFIYPSFYEGFGLPVVEAALQKTPVITSTLSSLPEAAGPDACLVDPRAKDAEEQMAHFMMRLSDDADYANGVATKMEEYARRMFTPETLTRQIMDLYVSMLC